MLEDNGPLLPIDVDEIIPGAKDESWELKKMGHKHRMIAMMLAGGMPQRLIAAEFEMNEGHISAIANSPLMVAEVMQIQDKIGLKGVEHRLKEILPEAVEVAYKRMTDPTTSATAAIGAAFSFIHQIVGKPTQKIEHTGDMYTEVLGRLDEMERLEKAKTVTVPHEELE
jgi:hypothetical protein